MCLRLILKQHGCLCYSAQFAMNSLKATRPCKTMLQKSRVYLFGLPLRAGNPFLSCLLDWVCCFITGKRGVGFGGIALGGWRMSCKVFKWLCREPRWRMASKHTTQKQKPIGVCQSSGGSRGACISRRVKRQGWLSHSRMPAEKRCQPRMQWHHLPDHSCARQGNAASCKRTLNFKLILKIRKKNMLDSYRTYRPNKV